MVHVNPHFLSSSLQLSCAVHMEPTSLHHPICGSCKALLGTASVDYIKEVLDLQKEDKKDHCLLPFFVKNNFSQHTDACCISSIAGSLSKERNVRKVFSHVQGQGGPETE
jgi:hypothetical protein